MRVRSAILVATLVPSTLVAATTIEASRPDGGEPPTPTKIPMMETEVLERASRPDDPSGFAITGIAEGAAGGMVTVELEPTQSERASLQPGDVLDKPLLAAAEVDPDERYQAVVSASDARSIGGRNLRITTLDSDGHIIGATVVDGPRDLAGVEVAASDEPALERGPRTPDAALDHIVRSADRTGALIADVAALRPTAAEDGAARGTPSGFAALAAPSNPCGVGTSCCRDYLDRQEKAWATVATAGSNTRYAKYRASFGEGISSRLGWSVEADGGGWSVGGGTHTISSSSFRKIWLWSNDYELRSYKMQALYDVYVTWCWVWQGWGAGHSSSIRGREKVPSGWTGGNTSGRWFGKNQFFPKYCTPQDFGEVYLENKKQSTIQNGVELWPIRVSARTDFSTFSAAGYDFLRDNKYLCGEKTWPFFDFPGRIMADWKDR